MTSTEVATEWPLRPIREVCRIVSGGTPPKSDAAAWRGTFPWASGKDLKTPTLRDTIDHITEDAAHAHSKIAPKGSVLVLVRGMGLANGLAVSLVERPMAFNQDLKALIPGEHVAGRFLMYGLMWAGEQVLQNVTTAAHGTKRLTQDDIADFPIGMPAMTEQAAISSVLDHVRAALDAVVKAEGTAQELKAAAMHMLFTRGLVGEPQKESEIGRVPASWDVVTLGSLGRIGNGSTPKKTVPEYWAGGTFPWLTSAKVYDGLIVAADEHVSNTALAECHLPILEPGAVLVAITGQGKTLGNSAVLGVRATISQHLAYLQTNQKRANPRFIKGYLDTQYQYLRQVASGGGSTKGALTCGFLREMPVPLPRTREEQDEIVAVLDAIDRKIELHRRKRILLEELFESLLHKLMTAAVRVADLDLSVLPELPEGA